MSVRCLLPKSNSKPRWPLMLLRKTPSSSSKCNNLWSPFLLSSLPSQGTRPSLKPITLTRPSMLRPSHIQKTSSFRWLCKPRCRPPTWVRPRATMAIKITGPTPTTSEKRELLTTSNPYKHFINFCLIRLLLSAQRLT